jgi:hypothetical protein
LYKLEGSSLSPACCRLISAQVPANLTQCKHEFEWAPFPPRVVLSRCRYCAVSQAHTRMPPLGLQTAKDCMKSVTVNWSGLMLCMLLVTVSKKSAKITQLIIITLDPWLTDDLPQF